MKAYAVCYCYRMHALKAGLDQQRAMEQLNGVANEVLILRLAIAKKELPAPSLHIDPKLAHRANMEGKRKEKLSQKATSIKQKEKEVEENKTKTEEELKTKEQQFEEGMKTKRQQFEEGMGTNKRQFEEYMMKREEGLRLEREQLRKDKEDFEKEMAFREQRINKRIKIDVKKA